MTALPKHKMTVDEYLAWAEGRPGRFELYAGIVYAMTPERAGHAKSNTPCRRRCWRGFDGRSSLSHAARRDDGAHRSGHRARAGRAGLLRSGLPASAVEVPNPVIVVEVLSPSTRHVDASSKLAGYFRIASVQHYLIVDPDKRLVVHHARGERDVIATRIVSAGGLRLDPPGIDLTIEELFSA